MHANATLAVVVYFNANSPRAGPMVAMFIANRRTFHRSIPRLINLSATCPELNDMNAVNTHGKAPRIPELAMDIPKSFARYTGSHDCKIMNPQFTTM